MFTGKSIATIVIYLSLQKFRTNLGANFGSRSKILTMYEQRFEI